MTDHVRAKGAVAKPPDPVAPVIEFKRHTPQERQGRDGYAIRFDYDPFLNKFVKKFPTGDRWFNVERKFWWLAEEQAHYFASVATTLGYTTEGITA